MKVRSGLSLIEALVTVVITLFVLSAVYFLFTSFFKGYREEELAATTEIERTLNLDILRFDIQQAGFGIGSDCKCNSADTLSDGDCLAIDYDKRKKGLVIRSTYNVTNKKTRGWGIVNCSSGTFDLKAGFLPRNASFVFLNVSDKKIVKGFDGGKSCPSNGIFLVFPYDPSVRSGCNNQYCNLIEYYLSSSSSTAPSYCARGTETLIRKVGNGRIPIVYCVADLKVRFKWNGNLVNPESLGSISLSEEKTNLQLVNVYLVVQEGKKDPSYNFSQNLELDGINFDLSHVTDYQHYRWKVIRISEKPMNLE